MKQDWYQCRSGDCPKVFSSDELRRSHEEGDHKFFVMSGFAKEEGEAILSGLGPDSPIEINEHGGMQSSIPYRCDLLDGKAMLKLAEVLKHGADKYDPDNWRSITTKEHVNHMLVHVFAWLAGDEQDDHLEHMLCRAMMAVAMDGELVLKPKSEIPRKTCITGLGACRTCGYTFKSMMDRDRHDCGGTGN